MNIFIGGNEKEAADKITLAALIKEEKVENPEYITVVVNEVFINKDDFEKTVLQEGDKVEFLYFMGGGSEKMKFSHLEKSLEADRQPHIQMNLNNDIFQEGAEV